MNTAMPTEGEGLRAAASPLLDKARGLLPNVKIDTDRLPHPTRFVEMTGIDRGKVGVFTRWIRPRQPLAA